MVYTLITAALSASKCLPYRTFPITQSACASMLTSRLCSDNVSGYVFRMSAQRSIYFMRATVAKKLYSIIFSLLYLLRFRKLHVLVLLVQFHEFLTAQVFLLVEYLRDRIECRHILFQ